MKHRSPTASFSPLCRRAAFVLAGSIAALLGVSPTPAATTVRFDGGPSGIGVTLDTAANWLGDVLPAIDSEVLFEDSEPGETLLPPQLTTGTSLSYGDLIWNSNTTSAITINTTTSTLYTITLRGAGESLTAVAAGGAIGDLLVMGTSATASTLTIGGNAGPGTGRLNLVLATSGNFDVVNSGATLIVNSVISGAFNLAKTGAGTLTLSGTNTFGSATNNFTLSAGTVNINSAAALGAAGNTFIINGGTFDNTSGAAITTSAYKQTWNGDFTFTGTNSLNLGAGAVSLGTAAGASRTVTVNGSTLTIGGVISEAVGGTAKSIIKDGAGTLTLNGANTFTGGVTIKNGAVVGGAAAAFGTTAGTITLGDTGGSNNASLLANGASAAVSIANAIVVASGSTGTLTIGNVSGGTLASTFSGAMSLGHDLVVANATQSSITLSGIITETGGARAITINAGSGSVMINNNNTFTGGVTLNSGRLQVGTHSTGAGVFTITGGSFDNASGAAAAVLNNSSYAWNGDFTFKGSFQVTLATGNVILSGDRTVTINNINAIGSSSLIVSGGIGDGGFGYSFTKRGVSGLTLNGASTYSGETIVREGLLNLTGAASALTNTSGVTVTGGTMTVGVASGAGVADRIKPTITLTLGGSGIFSLNAGASGPVNSQSFAGLAVVPGSGQLSTTATANAGTFSFTGAAGSIYTRSLGGTVRIVMGSNTSFTNAPIGGSTIGTGTSAILIGAVTVTGATATVAPATITDFVKAGAGVVSAPTYGTNLWNTGVNTDVTAPLSATGDTQSLRFNNSARLTVALTGTSTIESGGILLGSSALGGGVITGGALRAAAGQDLWIYASTAANNPQGLTIHSLIADNDASSLTKTGGGKLFLTNTNNSYAGGTYLGEGVLNVTSGGALGTGALRFTGNATLQAGGTAVALGTRAITIDIGQTATFDTNGSANDITASGIISGAGGLTKTGNGVLTLTGANTYTGQTAVSAGTLKLDFSAADAPVSNIISSNSLFTTGGGGYLVNGAFSQTVLIQGKDATANSQTFGGTYVNALGNPDPSGFLLGRGMTHLNLVAGGNGGTLTVNLGALSRGYSGDANDNIDFSIGAGVTVMVSYAAGIISGYATVNGKDWATVVGGMIVPYTSYTTNYGQSGGALDVGIGDTLTVNPNSLRFNNNSAATVGLGAGVVRQLVGAGILVTSNVGANLSTIGSGALTGVSTKDIIIHQNNTAGDLQIDASIVDLAARTMTLSKNGAGKVILTATNSNTGPTFVNEGTLVVTGNAVDSFPRVATSTAASNTLTVDDTTGIFIGQAVTGPGLTTSSVTWTVVAINSGSVTLSNNANVTSSGGQFTFGAGGGLGAGAPTHGIAIGATLQIGDGGATGSLVNSQGIANNGALILNRSNDFTLANIISGIGTLEKKGAGSVTLTAANTFTGDTKITGGSLILSAVTTNLQSSTLDYDNYGGSLAFGSIITATLGGLKGSQNLDLTNASAAPVGLTFGGNHQNTTYSGAITGGNGLIKTGGGTMQFTGSYMRTVYLSTAGIAVSGGTFNMSGTMGSELVPLGQAGFSGNSVTNFSGTEFLSSGASTFRVGDGTSGTVNLTAGVLTIGVSSSGVILGRNGDNVSGFLNVSGGSFIVTGNNTVVRIGAGFTDAEASAASVLSISGTGLFDTGVTTNIFLLGSNKSGSTASTGTLNLNGGTLATLRPITGGNVGASIFNFNGGTLKANGVTLTLNLGTLGVANVRNGGAVIDTNGYDIAMAQPLVHSTIAGDNATDGGLVKKGLGTLTLSGANAFTGAVAVNAGALALTGANTLAGPISVSNAALLSFSGGSTLSGAVTVDSGALTVNGANSFSGDVTVNAGSLTVNDTSAFTGRVDVNAGTLLVSGSISGSTGVAGVKVAAGASLVTGSATTIKTAANGNIDIGGTLSPGDFGTARTLTLDTGAGSKLNFLSGSTFKFDIGLTTASSDRVAFSTAGDWLSGSGNVTLALNDYGIGIDYGESYIVFANANTAGFHFANITGYDDENFFASVSLLGNNYVLTFAEVPEPGSLGSLLGGLGLLLGLHRFRRRRSDPWASGADRLALPGFHTANLPLEGGLQS